MSEVDATVERLEDQIAWYGRQAARNQNAFKRMKIVEIVAAAVIPFVSALSLKHNLAAAITGGLGVLITLLEGFQHLNQYQHNWITYRSTCEGLKHEKYLHYAKAGSYAGLPDDRAHAQLAERIEALISQENVQWTTGQEQGVKQQAG